MKCKKEYLPVEYKQLSVSAGRELPLKTRQWIIARLQTGSAQLRRERTRFERIDEKQVLVLTPLASGSLSFTKASSVQLILARPETLGGILTVTESLGLESWSRNESKALTVIRLSPSVREYFELFENQESDQNTLVCRLKILEAVVAIVAVELETVSFESEAKGSVARRLRQLASRMTEREFMQLSPTEMREVFNCRLNHFTRIFKDHFGMTLERRRLYLRIADARLALLENQTSIREIARATGFLSTELFARKFRDYTGMRPGKWQEEQMTPDESFLEWNCRRPSY